MTVTEVRRGCAECGRPMTSDRTAARPVGVMMACGRGLCAACYRRAEWAGTLDNYPRVMRRRVDVAEDFAELVATRQVRSRECAAHRLGMSLQALDRALYRSGVDVTAVAKRWRP